MAPCVLRPAGCPAQRPLAANLAGCMLGDDPSPLPLRGRDRAGDLPHGPASCRPAACVAAAGPVLPAEAQDARPPQRPLDPAHPQAGARPPLRHPPRPRLGARGRATGARSAGPPARVARCTVSRVVGIAVFSAKPRSPDEGLHPRAARRLDHPTTRLDPAFGARRRDCARAPAQPPASFLFASNIPPAIASAWGATSRFAVSAGI